MIITELSDSCKKNLGGRKGKKGLGEAVWQDACGKQIPQLNRNRENSLENPKSQYKL